MTAATCPRCGLTVTSRAGWLEPQHCPRCLARARLVVPLERVEPRFAEDEPAPGLQSSSSTRGEADVE